MLNSIHELVQFLHQNVPNFKFKTNGEYSSKSPLRVVDTWQGDDGFLWFFQAPHIHVWDRKLGAAPQPLKELWGVLPLPETDVDWNAVEAGLEQFSNLIERSKVVRTSPWSMVQQFHANVQRDYWYALNFTDELIDKFYLGYGIPAYYKYPRHTIPIPIAEFPGKWTFVSRRAVEADKVRHWRPAKSPNTFWYSDWNSKSKETLYVAEGSTSFLAALQMGFSPCVTTNEGAGHWNDAWTQLILQEHPEIKNVTFLPDNDAPGRKHVVVVQNSFQRFYKKTAREFKFYSIQWDADTPETYDPADVLQALGVELGYAWIENRIIYAPIDEFRETRKQYIPFVQAVEPIETISLENARDKNDRRSIQNSMQYFLNRSDAESNVLVLAYPPGTGKNYAVVDEMQRRAREHLYKIETQERAKKGEIAQLLEALDQSDTEEEKNEIRRAVARLERPVNKTLAVVASPFRESFRDMESSHTNFDPDLWYFLDSRNETNCGNFAKASIAANKGYNVSFLVCQSCPFKTDCEANGYLSQFNTMKEFPLISIRHQHLQIGISDVPEIIIDEFPGEAIFGGQSLTLTPNDIQLPHGWEEWVEFSKIKPIRMFIAILQAFISKGYYEGNRRAVLSGRQLFELLNAFAMQLADVNFSDVLEAIDSNILYGASFTNIEDEVEIIDTSWKEHWNVNNLPKLDVQEMPRRCVDIVYNLLLEELKHYKQDPYELPDWNGRIFLFGEQLIVRPMKPLNPPKNSKVIVMDAYPLIPVYERLFPERQILSYQPSIMNPDTKTIVLQGNSFAISEMKENLRIPATFKEDVFPNNLIKIAWDTIVKLSQQHKELLVITHKSPSDYLEARWAALGSGKVHFRNYRSLRGLNTYINADACLLIGMPRKPDTSIEMELQSLNYDKPQLVFTRGSEYTIPYHNREDGYKVWSFTDKVVHDAAYAEMIAEVRQAAARIRPHTSKEPKHVYILSSIPALEWVTDVQYYTDWIYNRDRDTLETWAQNWMQQEFQLYKRIPGQNRLAQALRHAGMFTISNEAVRDLHHKLKGKIQ